jgi:type VI secretion system protein ImpE
MTPQELLQAGRLTEAIAAQTAEVKSHPTDADRRFLLFTLLSFAGELERAEVHLEAVSLAQQDLKTGSAVYHSLLAAEFERRKVYREGSRPVLPPNPPGTVELRLQALASLRAGDAAATEAALDEAAEQGVALRGKLNGEPFGGLRDYDDVLGQILEIYAGGRCLWMPLERIRKLEIAEPGNPLDLLWARADLLDATGTQASVHLPALYEGSCDHPDERVRLGRSTEWIDCRDVAFRGAGQKILLAAQGEEERETAILELRTLELEGGPADDATG